MLAHISSGTFSHIAAQIFNVKGLFLEHENCVQTYIVSTHASTLTNQGPRCPLINSMAVAECGRGGKQERQAKTIKQPQIKHMTSRVGSFTKTGGNSVTQT